MKQKTSELKNEMYETRLKLFNLIEKLKTFEKALEEIK